MSYKQKLKKRGPKKNWAKNQPRAGFYNPNSITMTILDNKGHTQYARINQNTIDMLDWVLEDKEYEINDSGDPILESLSNFKSIAFDFRNISKGKRIVGAFFPYYNNSDIDLTPYGIYKRGEVHTHTVCVPYYKAAPYNISHTKKFSRAK